MIDCDCGVIAAVEDARMLRPVGIITDRDIACRIVAKRWRAIGCRESDVMTAEPATL